MKLSYLTKQNNHTARLLSLVLASAMLASLYGDTSYAGPRSRFSGVANPTGAPGLEPTPQTPPLKANGKIAFSRFNDGHIHVMNSDGSQQSQLTNNANSAEYAPSWSPNGTKLAFLSRSASGDFLKLMSADGSNQTTLTSVILDSVSQIGTTFSWSPDGRKIAFSSAGDIFTIDIDGSNLVNLTNHPMEDGEPDWSPDGSKIAFASNRSDPYGEIFSVHTMHADGGDVRLYTEAFVFAHTTSPKWSPDSHRLTFVVASYYDGPGIGSLVSGTEAGTQFVTHVECCAFGGFDWSPDGAKFVLAYALSPQYQYGIYSLAAESGSLSALRLGEGSYFPDWQPLVPAAACANPIDCAEFFVRQHYRDFLNREADTNGLAFWTNEITSCGVDQSCIDAQRGNVSAAFFLSIEFQQTGYLVYRIYKASYGNLAGAPVPITLSEFLPDTQQIGQGVIVNQPGWQQVLENNKRAFAADFVARSRFTSAFPTSLTPAEFVDTLFANAGVTPSAGDRMNAVNEFGSATTTSDSAARARALRRVAENSMLAQQEFNRAFVLMQYFGYLHRNPNDPPELTLDFQGYNFWLTKLNQFNGDYSGAEMVKAFITSGEYRQRFGP